MCFDNDDTADIYEQTDVKTRKPHRCAGCRKIIPAGSRMSYTRCLFDGSWSNWYECEDGAAIGQPRVGFLLLSEDR